MKEVFGSENIRFTELDEALVPDYLKMVNDTERVGRFAGMKSAPISAEKEIKWVRGKLAEHAPVWSMIARADDSFIGIIEIKEAQNGEGELGISITADKQDRGFGTEAIRATLKYVKEAMGLKRVCLKVYPDNPRAIHVYRACGFTEYDRNEHDVFMEIFL